MRLATRRSRGRKPTRARTRAIGTTRPTASCRTSKGPTRQSREIPRRNNGHDDKNRSRLAPRGSRPSSLQSTRNEGVRVLLKVPKGLRRERPLSRGNRGVARGGRRLYKGSGRSPFEATSTKRGRQRARVVRIPMRGPFGYEPTDYGSRTIVMTFEIGLPSSVRTMSDRWIASGAGM